jgi:hypothetical protein
MTELMIAIWGVVAMVGMMLVFFSFIIWRITR